MIAHTNSADSTPSTPPSWQAAFDQMLPAIERHARICFRHLKADRREEAVQEVVCNACLAYARLFEQGRAEAATWSSLARYAVAQVRVGREVGAPLNGRDVLSPYARRRNGLTVERLDWFDPHENAWQEVLVEDKTVTPADLAASRIDFPAWLDTLPQRDRGLAEALAKG